MSVQKAPAVSIMALIFSSLKVALSLNMEVTSSGSAGTPAYWDDMLHYIDFEGTTTDAKGNGVITDSNGNCGTLGSYVEGVSGPGSQAFHWDTTGWAGCIWLLTPNVGVSATEWSFSFWYKPDTTQSPGSARLDWLYGTPSWSGINCYGCYHFTMNRNNDPDLEMYHYGPQMASPTFQAGQWYNFFVSQGPSTFSLYVDGVLQQSVSKTAVAGDGVPIRIMVTSGGGAIDDLIFYSKGFSDAEVTTLGGAPPTPSTPPPTPAPTPPATPSPTSAPVGFMYDEYIGGCCSGQNQLGTPLSNPTIADCKTYCDSESTCVSFEVYPQSHTTPNFNCWFSTTCAVNEVPALNCGHDLYIKGAPTAAGAAAGASAVGDPHLQNVHGERFDLMKPGKHVLINIPRGESAETALLRVQADARQLGGQCADMYFQEVNITGSWAEAQQAGGYHYSVSQDDVGTPEWAAFGKVGLKVVRGRTGSGLSYLNVYVKHLGRAGFAVGGLLGEDDHQDVITPPEACAKRMALVDSVEEGRRGPSVVSVAEASLA